MTKHASAALVGIVLACLTWPATAAAWGYEGHRIIAAIARSYLTPAVRERLDDILAADTDNTAAHDMESAATWADAWRTNHRETASWHFVDIELDHPDLASACFSYPAPARPASAGPAQDCLVDRLNAFTAELASPATDPAERTVALKYVLHFVGDLHQPLHASDNHDRGGNCVLLSLGGPRSVNLHSYWDTGVVEAMGPDSQAVASELRRHITAAQKTSWERGDPKSWALESFEVAKASVYTLGTKPGCGDQAPVSLPPGYAAAAKAAAAIQLEKAGVRLASVLNQAFR